MHSPKQCINRKCIRKSCRQKFTLRMSLDNMNQRLCRKCKGDGISRPMIKICEKRGCGRSFTRDINNLKYKICNYCRVTNEQAPIGKCSQFNCNPPMACGECEVTGSILKIEQMIKNTVVHATTIWVHCALNFAGSTLSQKTANARSARQFQTMPSILITDTLRRHSAATFVVIAM
jgi:hypothetical protein